MANKTINELPALLGNEIEDMEVITLPIQTVEGTKSINLKELLQTVLTSNQDLANKCNALNARLAQVETDASHLIINQYYGGAAKIDTGSVSHAFIELYNPTAETISLTGKSLHYFFSTTVSKLDLTGEIPANTSFLVRCKLTNDSSLGVVPKLDLTDAQADMEWDIFLSNKCIAIALMNSTNEIASGTNPTTLEDYIDLIGSTDDKNAAVPCSEGQPAFGQSKQKSIRRILFTDTNNNKVDCEIVDFRIKENLHKAPRSVADGAWTM